MAIFLCENRTKRTLANFRDSFSRSSAKISLLEEEEEQEADQGQKRKEKEEEEKFVPEITA